MNENNGMSIIVPFLNESEGILLFCKTMDEIAATLSFPIELVFVDDGSTDDSSSKLTSYNFKNIGSVRLLSLSKNYGSHAAIRAGLTKATYGICTWLGSDLQEPLELIPICWEKINDEKYDAVYIEKNSVKGSRVGRMISKIYHYLMKKYAIKNYSSGGIATAVFNGKIKSFLNQNIEANSSIILQVMDVGFNNCTLSMDYGARAAGTSKWTLSKKIKVFIDSFVAFSFMPIRLVSIVGIIIFLIGFIIGLGTIINRFVNPEVPIGYSTLTSILALGFGITNISLGIIAEYLWRAYDEARNRPVFIIADEKEIR